MQADPTWPVFVLAAFQAGDAVACAIPAKFITDALDRVDCPPEVRRALPWVKGAAALGLLIGLWLYGLGPLTCVALIAYFVIAIAFHARAHDEPRNWVAAIVMLGFSCYVLSTFL